MKIEISIINDLKISINYGDCLQIIKNERQRENDHFQALLNADPSLEEIRTALHRIQAYDFVIEKAQDYLDHKS